MLRRFARRSLALAALLLPSAAGAQAAAGGCAARFPLTPTDTAHRILRLTLGKQAPTRPLAMRGWAELVLQTLADNFRAPTSLSVPELARRRYHPAAADTGDVPEVNGLVLITIDTLGTLVSVRPLASSGSPEIDAAIVAAANAADSAHAFIALPDAYRQPFAAVPVHVTTRPARDGAASIALVRLALPYTRAPRPITPADKRAGPSPRYPTDARQEGVGDDVVMQFVVDTAGRADMTTATALEFTDLRFVRAVMAVLPAWRFVPARDEGCPLRQLVQLPFSFRVVPGSTLRPGGSALDDGGWSRTSPSRPPPMP